ncbi:uncharacterized protein LOC122003476 [Zingiber officinale]|uniref:uncharacterized protein LOC122003476 n=1 Tax=Zingiber officinale TaxID=94328 RepID=UPI001C4D7F93|nr:uncharacterized protein LOC122003476 [Zingiber officinale]
MLYARVAVALLLGFAAWVYKDFVQPPPPRICGRPLAPPVTAPRIVLNDGRHLAYKESGASKDEAKYKIIAVHGFDSTRDSFPASQELLVELGIYLLTFDRAGYGESDPNPKRSVKSEAFDIEELADKLEIGDKFYLVGISMGAYAAWSCLSYIPHRLRGVALVVPAINYWWRSLPAETAAEAYGKLAKQDRWAFRIAHYLPFFFHGWMTQKWFDASAVSTGNPIVLSEEDKKIRERANKEEQITGFKKIARQQGAFESAYRDVMVVFSNWEFDPTDIVDPFPNNDGSVHIWQGSEDKIVQKEVQRYIAKRLPWIHYHEDPEAGHLFFYEEHWHRKILEELLIRHDYSGERNPIHKK